MKVHRKGQEVALRYRLHQRRPLVPVLHGVDCVPSYLIVGGLVFVPLSIPFLEHAYGGALSLPADLPLYSRMTVSWEFCAEHASMLLKTFLCKLYVFCPRLGRLSPVACPACFMAVQGRWLFSYFLETPAARDLCLGRPQGRIGASWRL